MKKDGFHWMPSNEMVTYSRLKTTKSNASTDNFCLVMLIDDYSRWDQVPCNKTGGFKTMCELQFTDYLGNIYQYTY